MKKILFSTLLMSGSVFASVQPVTPPYTVLGNPGPSQTDAQPVSSDPTLHNPYTFPCNLSGSQNQNQDCLPAPPVPQGRLSLSATNASPNSDIFAANVIYYLPYVGTYVPVWSTAQSGYLPLSIGTGISLNISNSTNFPANSLQDIYVFNNSGSPNICAVQWGTSTAGASSRGSNAAISKLSGIWVNSQNISCNVQGTTNTITTQQGTLIGTIAIGPIAAQTAFQMNPTAAVGGPANGCFMGLSNIYNTIRVSCIAPDSCTQFTTVQSAWESYDLSSNNRVYWVDSVGSVNYDIKMHDMGSTNTATYTVYSAIGINSNTTASGLIDAFQAASTATNGTAYASGMAPLSSGGLNYAQALDGQVPNNKLATFNPRFASGGQVEGLIVEISY